MKNIGIYSNADKDKDFAGTAAVISALSAIRLTRDGVGVFMDISQECAVRDSLGEDAVRDVVFLPEREMTRTIDVMIVLGGDGTLLKAARRCSPRVCGCLRRRRHRRDDTGQPYKACRGRVA